MKVTVEISEKDLKDILRVTREKRKGAAIRQLAMEALMLKKRREILDELEAGKWSVDLPPIETLRQDRELWRR
jgi:SpoVK/Ycf46/Vps4 family AAA+-type ATPase